MLSIDAELPRLELARIRYPVYGLLSAYYDSSMLVSVYGSSLSMIVRQLD